MREIMFALIHQPARNAMQSGTKKTLKWVIEFPKQPQRLTDPLTGMTGATDMLQQVNLEFDTKESAIAYAKSKSIPYRVLDRAKPKRKGRGYSDNFAYDRKFPWTH